VIHKSMHALLGKFSFKDSKQTTIIHLYQNSLAAIIKSSI